MLNILAYVRFFPPHSNCGSDRYLLTVLKFLQSRGHEVTVMLGEDAKGCPYEYNGIQVVSKPLYGLPYIPNADIVFTQLDFTADCCNMVKTKPIVWFMHNTANQATVRRNKDRVIVIYNSYAAMKEIEYPNSSFVLPVPVDIDWYDVERDTVSARNITLINMNESKGGELFWKLAEEMPEEKFLGVKGSYGVQWVNRSLPNVEIVENTDDIREVYKRTKILIMPSSYESWGRTATEASASGIPVICTDTFGLRENMGDAAIYCRRNVVNDWVMAIKKVKKEYDKYSKMVREQAEKNRPDKKLEEFEELIHKIARKPIKKQEYGQLTSA